MTERRIEQGGCDAFAITVLSTKFDKTLGLRTAQTHPRQRVIRSKFGASQGIIARHGGTNVLKHYSCNDEPRILLQLRLGTDRRQDLDLTD